MTFLLLSLSVILSTGRNLFSKKLSGVPFGTGAFFLCQAVLFLSGALSLLLFGGLATWSIAPVTVAYAVLYGLLLLLAQWLYTAALARGNTALCSTVYSLGFLLPTLSGAVLWAEAFSPLDAVGVLCAVGAVTCSGMRRKGEEKAGKARYFLPLLIAMLASGGLGIVQKLQQRSEFADQKTLFLLIAFLFAAAVSLLFALGAKGKSAPPLRRSSFAVAAPIGVCFGCCNLLNTTLAGLLPGAVFFPTLNIGVIVLSMLAGVVFFKERLTKKEISVLLLGGASILLLNIG